MFKTKMLRKNFSLIELLIVIGIMGALAALILPAFSDSETAAKDTACDYNQAGTLRYLTMFRSVNGVYPAGFHTGGGDKDWTNPVNTTNNATATVGDLTTCAAYNFVTASTTTELTDYVDSLEAAGIVKLAYGANSIKDIVGDAAEAVKVKAVTAAEFTHTHNGAGGCEWSGTGAYWTEALDPITGEVDADGEPLLCRGTPLSYIAKAFEDPNTYTTTDHVAQFVKAGQAPSIIVPVYVAPTVDWTTYYMDGANPSKVSIAMAGKCPWGEGGQARYYIAFFRVFSDETPAELLCTSCPDCGILDATTF